MHAHVMFMKSRRARSAGGVAATKSRAALHCGRILGATAGKMVVGSGAARDDASNFRAARPQKRIEGDAHRAQTWRKPGVNRV